MRITKQHYTALETAINGVLSSVPEDKIISVRQNVKFVNDQFVSFCWAVLFEAIRLNDSLRYITDSYKDTHIETAIKKILKKYK